LTPRHGRAAACQGGCLQRGSAGPPVPPGALTQLCTGARYQRAATGGSAGSELLLEEQDAPRPTPPHWQRTEREAGSKARATPRDDGLRHRQADAVKLQA